MKVLLLGGTGEARTLAGLLTAEGIEVVSSLAGRTTDARLPVGEVRTGGFGGADGLAAWLRDHPVDLVVDATHPFAATMTAHAVAATRETGVPLLVLRRPGWTPGPDDNWHWADSATAAADLLRDLRTSRVFLTIGRQGLDAFATTGLWTLARCVDPPEPRPTWCTLILARGPFTLTDELAILREHRIDVLVTKDSGGPATAAKLTAARRLAIPVLVIRRPSLPIGPEVVETVRDAVQWVIRTNHSSSS
ncbi:precorrin-6A/cobalt-precorrin-6A reductase [Kribbella rubisoli]|uniref:Precorrin-6A/cobalt-precorrin-6A reductase n=1 Tax=Kribbella rubisoli TaxID=3075929 RepID=A0A4Q7X7J4_9ACTN|nr:cobalt-precorrin-6A reductase [Kribbella rubisoli]RZU18419.1 precorrin-6A/cobalt-precorrin-6A reductase [Kribbella rubisoli]